MLSMYCRQAIRTPLSAGATFVARLGHDGRGDTPAERGRHGGMP